MAQEMLPWGIAWASSQSSPAPRDARILMGLETIDEQYVRDAQISTQRDW